MWGSVAEVSSAAKAMEEAFALEFVIPGPCKSILETEKLLKLPIEIAEAELEYMFL